MTNVEVWKPIKGYEGLYEVSNKGRVRTLDKMRISDRYRILMKYKGKIIRPGKNAQGYLKLDLCKNGTKKTCRVNRLVLATCFGVCIATIRNIINNTAWQSVEQ